jgi:hypothetical protein
MRYFVTGGCTYRMLRHEQSAGSIMELAVFARGDASLTWGGHYAMHTSNLPQGRALWLRDLISSQGYALPINVGISVDGDTAFSALALLREIPLVTGDVAIGLCPVRIGGTEDLCNLCLSTDDEAASANLRPVAERRISWGAELRSKLKSSDRDIASGGFGVAVFNLDWYRRHWPLPEPEAVSILTGEDIEHCRSVRKRGGRIIALAVPTDHFAWGEKQTR